MKKKSNQNDGIDCSLPKLERLVMLKRLILAENHATAGNLAAELKVSERTIFRYVEFMRSRLDMPIHFDSAHETYQFTGPAGPLPGEKPSDNDITGAVVATRLLERFEGMTWYRAVENILQHSIAQGDREQKARSKKLRPAVYFQQPDVPEPTDPVLFETIMTACWKGQALRFLYCKPLDEFRPRMVDPYVLTAFDGCWYLLAMDHVAEKIRTFKLCRMREAKVMGQKFAMPANFDPEAHYDKSLGFMTSDGDFEVEVELSALMTASLDGRRYRAWKKWDKLPDGRSIVIMQLSCLEEVQRWALSWDEKITVRKPIKLRERMYKTSLNVAAKYAPAAGVEMLKKLIAETKAA